MKKKDGYQRMLHAVSRFVVFFLLMAFLITSCLMLFMDVLEKTMGIVPNEADLERAAKLTFGNVVLLSLLFTAADTIRRKITVDRPARRIIAAAEKMMQGDFSAQVTPGHALRPEMHFREIGECFNRMARELAGIETLRADFIANVSHELKTPLAVIQNYAVLLQQEGLEDEKRLEYARASARAAGRLSDLVSNILKLNRLENQQIFPATQAYDLGEQLCECLLQFEDEWERKRLKIETDIEDGVMANSDPELMSLVWNNLFSNAIKFTAEDGRISLSLHMENGAAEVRVTDSGCGMSPEVGRHIFDKFFQGDASHAPQGNGLGLALVKKVIEITGSVIMVESRKGVGTTFTVRMAAERRKDA